MNKKKLTVAILAIGLPGLSTLLLSDNVHAATFVHGNPSGTFLTATDSEPNTVDYNGTHVVSYQTAMTSGANGINFIQIGVVSVQLGGGVYLDGVNLTCSQSGFHNTGWQGPFTTASQGSWALYCNFNGTDIATNGEGAGYYY
jgi:hypothetical protein